jgi:hypothetical protein
MIASRSSENITEYVDSQNKIMVSTFKPTDTQIDVMEVENNLAQEHDKTNPASLDHGIPSTAQLESQT